MVRGQFPSWRDMYFRWEFVKIGIPLTAVNALAYWLFFRLF
jgi:hypothetical protein